MFKFKQITSAIFSVLLFSFLFIHNGFANHPAHSPVFVEEYIGQIEFVSERLSQLLGAMSQDQMSWTPAEGVRTTAEVYLHVAEANYFLASKMGGHMPYEEMYMDLTDKDKIDGILKESFKSAAKLAANLTEEDLNKTVNTPFGDMSLRNFMISLLNHSHEHLGQGIAYARMNGITPPWSKKDSEG